MIRNTYLIELSNLGKILSSIGNKLISSQTILKCIAYDNKNALSQPDVSINEKVDLIGGGSDPQEQQRIFKVPFNDNIIEDARTELRFFFPVFRPNNQYLSDVVVTFQLIIHNSLWELSNNSIRAFILIEELLKNFNGYDVDSVGELYLDGPIRIVTWSKNYSGYELIFKGKTK